MLLPSIFWVSVNHSNFLLALSSIAVSSVSYGHNNATCCRTQHHSGITNGSISFSLMACGSSWASSASGCTAGVALFHLFPVFLLGPACWLRHGVLVANAEIQGNKREYSASLKLGFRWHAVTPAHPPVTQQSSNVAWSNVKMLRSTVGR